MCCLSKLLQIHHCVSLCLRQHACNFEVFWMNGSQDGPITYTNAYIHTQVSHIAVRWKKLWGHLSWNNNVASLRGAYGIVYESVF